MSAWQTGSVRADPSMQEPCRRARPTLKKTARNWRGNMQSQPVSQSERVRRPAGAADRSTDSTRHTESGSISGGRCAWCCWYWLNCWPCGCWCCWFAMRRAASEMPDCVLWTNSWKSLFSEMTLTRY
ncbi:hypothetical protein BC831DRAFT_462026 [Entophlyctis helioformis]|nr:hypothetical protein BC831DRAFT_462026 [Entophlyctis helioformis]